MISIAVTILVLVAVAAIAKGCGMSAHEVYMVVKTVITCLAGVLCYLIGAGVISGKGGLDEMRLKYGTALKIAGPFMVIYGVAKLIHSL